MGAAGVSRRKLWLLTFLGIAQTKFRRIGPYKMKKFFLLSILGFLLVAPGGALGWPATVVSVHDGDSLRIRDSYGKTQIIRLYGIDAPELETDNWPKQPHSAESRDLLRELLRPGMRVDVRVDQDLRSYGRLVATVTLLDGRVVNKILLEEGAVWWYGQHCRKNFCREWRAAENRARSDKAGLWDGGDPIPPWEWRQKWD